MQSMYFTTACLFAVALLAPLSSAQYEEYGSSHLESGHNFGGEHHHHEPQHHEEEEHHEDYHAHPKYAFDYSVKDPHTGDEKEHWETRDGDVVKGQYSLLEADGTKRIVEYESTKKGGFNAIVHHVGTPKVVEEHHEGHEEAAEGHPEIQQHDYAAEVEQTLGHHSFEY